MERIGVHYYSARGLLERASECRHAIVEGIYSHFANADAADLDPRGIQLERFLEVLAWYDKRARRRPCATSPTRAPSCSSPRATSTWCGRASCSTASTPRPRSRRTIAVRPALAWKSRVVYFKVVTPGHPVSYGSTWQTDHPTRVVTVPVGYGDGYFRALSNVAQVIIRGKPYPVVGRVCMDQIMVNIEWDTAYNGDRWCCSAGRATRPSPASTSPEWAGTIPYEILTNINNRVPRVYV